MRSVNFKQEIWVVLISGKHFYKNTVNQGISSDLHLNWIQAYVLLVTSVNISFYGTIMIFFLEHCKTEVKDLFVHNLYLLSILKFYG